MNPKESNYPNNDATGSKINFHSRFLDPLIHKIKEFPHLLREHIPIGKMQAGIILVGILGLCNTPFIFQQLVDETLDNNQKSTEIFELSSDPINWEAVLADGYLSEEVLGDMVILSESYEQKVEVKSNQVMIVEMSPFKDEGYGEEFSGPNYSAILAVIGPGTRNLPFQEETSGSWMTHTFTFPSDLNKEQRAEMT